MCESVRYLNSPWCEIDRSINRVRKSPPQKYQVFLIYCQYHIGYDINSIISANIRADIVDMGHMPDIANIDDRYLRY